MFAARFQFVLLPVCTSQTVVGAAEIKYLHGHSGPVRAVSISPQGSLLVSAADDSRVIVRSIGDLQQKDVFRPREGGLRCLAFSQDGKYVLASGNLADFSRTTEIDGVVRINLKERKQDFIELPVRGTTVQMTLADKDTRLVYFCGSRELLTFDTGQGRIVESVRFFGGFTEATAISPDSRHFAVTSQDEVNMRAAEPCRLTTMKRDGKVTLSYEFANAGEYRGARIQFPANDRLILCLPSGKMLRWKWSKTQEHWENLGKAIPIVKGRFSTIGCGFDGRVVWLARGRTLVAINSQTGEMIQEIEVNIGERQGGNAADPIECVTVLKDRKMLVAGLWDGRLALVPIDSEGGSSR